MPQPPAFHGVTLLTAAVAASATFGVLAAGLPAWAMFLGWVGYSLSGQTVREGAGNLAAWLLGLALGLVNGAVTALATPTLGVAATPLVVLADVLIVLSLRNVAPINNPLAWFLGLITWFASGSTPSADAVAPLAVAGVVGAVGAGLAATLQAVLPRQRS